MKGEYEGQHANSGGLTRERIDSYSKLLTKINRGFYSRPTPISIYGTPAPAGFGKKLGEKIQNLHNARREQISAKILRAALDMERKRNETAELSSVILFEGESGTTSHQSRKLNRQRRAEAAATIRDKLTENAFVHGIKVLEIEDGQYRYDSHTGHSGWRFQAVPVQQLVRPEGALYETLVRAKERISKTQEAGDPLPGKLPRYKQAGSVDDYFDFLANRWNQEEQIWQDQKGHLWKFGNDKRWKPVSTAARGQSPQPILIPDLSGTVFVSADSDSPLSTGFNAGKNHALTNAIEAYLDPDWQGRWKRILVDPNTKRIVSGAKTKSQAFEKNATLKVQDGEATKTEKYTYAWRDSTEKPITESEFMLTADYWENIKQQALLAIMKQFQD